MNRFRAYLQFAGLTVTVLATALSGPIPAGLFVGCWAVLIVLGFDGLAALQRYLCRVLKPKRPGRSR